MIDWPHNWATPQARLTRNPAAADPDAARTRVQACMEESLQARVRTHTTQASMTHAHGRGLATAVHARSMGWHSPFGVLCSPQEVFSIFITIHALVLCDQIVTRNPGHDWMVLERLRLRLSLISMICSVFDDDQVARDLLEVK